MSDYLATLGKTSKTTILAIEDGKISLEFEVNAAVEVKTGMPVKLVADGKITPWAKADSRDLLIGHAYQDGEAGDLVTVFMRSHMVMYALSSEAISCATPVTQTDWEDTTLVDGGEYDGQSGYNRVEQTGADSPIGWALDQAVGADELIKVAVMH
jgi:hypothetical protein